MHAKVTCDATKHICFFPTKTVLGFQETDHVANCVSRRLTDIYQGTSYEYLYGEEVDCGLYQGRHQ
ncbi:hypothetical protein PHLCEN_2v78 [Hermanssonia centrifuga]|uniref:Uncharacterized protein n=1 Tax=Hermanssonia centrifuga TaxID=98765 RepID=A0A2R6S724_9APHY|nr:hypothetical protein PHLCEN_2v78 [Hermanssonia centrifuga]